VKSRYYANNRRVDGGHASPSSRAKGKTGVQCFPFRGQEEISGYERSRFHGEEAHHIVTGGYGCFLASMLALAQTSARWEGIVSRSNKQKSTLTVRTRGFNNVSEKVIHYDSSTRFSSQEHGAKKINDIDANQVKDGDRVICLGYYDEKGEFKPRLYPRGSRTKDASVERLPRRYQPLASALIVRLAPYRPRRIFLGAVPAQANIPVCNAACVFP